MTKPAGRPNWFKLDNAAKIYPPSATRRWQSMFRVSVTLDEDVDPALLQLAHERTLHRLPSFAVRLRKGLFWYYLEYAKGTPPLVEDTQNPCQTINPHENRGFLYRLLYWRGRIALEFFHVLADGTGGMTFLMTLANEYLRLVHGEDAAPAKYILSCDDEPRPGEYEDAFPLYAGKAANSPSDTGAYHPRGRAVPLNRLLLTMGTVPTDALAAKAREHGVTVGVFLSSLLVWAVHEHQLAERSRRRRKQPVKICVPINLRRFFPSETVRNFSAFVNIGIDARLGTHSFEEILTQIKHQMGMLVNEKTLGAWLTYNVKAERNLFVRIVPLFVKRLILKAVFTMQGDRYSSITCSNLGRVDLPEPMAGHVQRVDFCQGRSVKRRTNACVVSFGGQTFIDFSRNLREADIERRFFAELVRLGVPVTVDSNGTIGR